MKEKETKRLELMQQIRELNDEADRLGGDSIELSIKAHGSFWLAMLTLDEDTQVRVLKHATQVADKFNRMAPEMRATAKICGL